MHGYAKSPLIPHSSFLKCAFGKDNVVNKIILQNSKSTVQKKHFGGKKLASLVIADRFAKVLSTNLLLS